MNSNLQFPNADVIKKYLNSYPFFQINYYQKAGITKAISELAANRLGNSNKTKMQVKIEVKFFIHHLQVGEDGFTGKPLPNLGKLGLSLKVWDQIANITERALNDCANSVRI